MPRFLVRRTTDGVAIGPARQCYGVTAVVAVPGVRTVEEWVHALLEDDESVVGALDQPKITIVRGDDVVGYFEIVHSDPA
jgi:hypothetical protein